MAFGRQTHISGPARMWAELGISETNVLDPILHLCRNIICSASISAPWCRTAAGVGSFSVFWQGSSLSSNTWQPQTTTWVWAVCSRARPRARRALISHYEQEQEERGYSHDWSAIIYTLLFCSFLSLFGARHSRRVFHRLAVISEGSRSEVPLRGWAASGVFSSPFLTKQPAGKHKLLCRCPTMRSVEQDTSQVSEKGIKIKRERVEMM